MRNFILISSSLVALSFATNTLADTPAKASATAAKDLKWVPFNPADPKGVQISPIVGNPGDPKATGPVVFLLKNPAGGKAPQHLHNKDYYATVLAGTPSHGDDEKSAKPMVPGSVWFESGKHPHFDACPGKEECIIQITFPKGPVDFVAVGADGKPLPPPPKAKK